MFRPSNAVFHEEKIKFNENIKDPDTDNTGFDYHWTLERYNVRNISNISGTPDDTYTFTTKTPFIDSFLRRGLKAGAYKITLQVQDKPPVPPYKSSDPITVYKTRNYYVVPQISMSAGVEHDGEVQVGHSIKLKATTSKEVEKVTCNFNGELLNLRNVKSGNSKEWELDYVIPETIEGGTYQLQFKAQTTYGGNGRTTREVRQDVPIDITSLKLINFRITDIVNHPHLTFPITKEMLENNLVEYKTGYYVTFQINAKGKPTSVKADIDIKDNGTVDETVSMAKVGTAGQEQIWEGRFYTNARLADNTVISIELEAKKGKNIYKYNDKENWDGRSLIIKGSALGDARINRTN